MAVAIAAGLDKLSLWWVLIPVFFAAALILSNGPGNAVVLRANEEGQLGVFPKLLAYHAIIPLTLAAAAYGLTLFVS